jgi:hypothetical protein
MTTNAPKKKTSMSKYYSPMDLASIFSAGVLCGKWTTQTAAAQELQVTQSKLSRGVSVSSLPRDFEPLFVAEGHHGSWRKNAAGYLGERRLVSDAGPGQSLR